MVFYYNSNGQGVDYLAFGADKILEIEQGENAWERLDQFVSEHNSWIFGYFTYDLKNEIEALESKNTDRLQFPRLCFFIPQSLYQIENGQPEKVYGQDIDSDRIQPFLNKKSSADTRPVQVKSRTSKEDYIQNVKDIIHHIQVGDIYEMNYCQEFFAEDVKLNTWETYKRLNRATQAPYSVYMDMGNWIVMGGSPELFLEKRGEKIISKPIKGTTRRGDNPKEDTALKIALQNNIKERAENVMIVDIVRNDLSRTALRNSVEVTELCEVYSYETVHQMISQVESKMDESTSPVEVIKWAFPMGSMTGAPKIRAMELIEDFEEFKRGLYSGAIGFFTPEKDFKFNVVIRSILYNKEQAYCSMSAGGAITSLSDPQAEYEESLLKADALKKALVIDEE